MRSRFGERPGPLAACLILLPLAVALISATMFVIFFTYGAWSDAWGGVRAVLAIGVGLLIASVVVVATTSTTGNFPDSQSYAVQGQQNVVAPPAFGRRRFGDRPGVLVTVIILEILSTAALSASTTNWLLTKTAQDGFEDGIFTYVWGGAYVFFGIGMVLIVTSVIVAVSTTKMPRQIFLYPPQGQHAAQFPASVPPQPMGMVPPAGVPPAGDPVAQVPVDPQPQSAPSTASTDQSEPESSVPCAD